MATSGTSPPPGRRVRREPPAFRPVAVRRARRLGPRMVEVTLAAADLADLAALAPDAPAASVRLLLPPPGETELVLPSWNGNEFLLPGGRRPTIRTLTPRRVDPDAGELDVDVVLHDVGAASRWADGVTVGSPAAVSGPGRGYAVDPDAPAFLVAGDETAIPAMSQLLEWIPPDVAVDVHVEVARPDARLALPHHARATVEWHDLLPGAPPGDALVAAVRDAPLPDGTRVWVAGEAAAVQRIRRHLFAERGVPRALTSVRGYWKQGRAGDTGDTGDA